MKKITWIIISVIIGLCSLVAIISLKLINPFKPSFYTYSSYADQKTINEISKKYSYKEYGSAKDFEYSLENNKAIAGVASDYSIISLINDGKIAPISKTIKKIKNIDEGKNWDVYFSDQSIEQMNFFDSYLKQEKLLNLYKDYGYTKFKFSDFVVPYFINDKLLAVDTNKLLGIKDTEKDFLGFGNKIPTLEEALLKIQEKALDKNVKIQWTKNERENTIYGSTTNNPKFDDWSTQITDENYEEWINNFASIVEKGTGATISNIKRNLFETDSDVILNNLINPTSNISVASIYNGDALDAYFGHDNFQSVIDGDRVRIIRTKYTIRILDCFVVSSSVNQNDLEQILKDFDETLFNGMFLSEEDIENKANEIEDIYSLNGIMRIFDYVNYTPAAKGPYHYIFNNYFLNDDGTQDELARDIYQVASTNLSEPTIFVKNLAPTDKQTLSKLTQLFQQKLNGY